MSELLIAAVKKLSGVVNVSAGIGHPNDEDRAKELFKALHTEGEPLIKSVIYNAAVSEGWEPRHAKVLSELGERIGQGRRVVVRNKMDWGQPAVLALKEKIAKAKSATDKIASESSSRLAKVGPPESKKKK